jgi:hypothetical protein
MTFNFFDWSRAFPAYFADNGCFNVRARPLLVAHWQRGADGKLECRWVLASDTGLSKSADELLDEPTANSW